LNTRLLTLVFLICVSGLCRADQQAVPGAKNVGEFLALGQVEVAKSRVAYCVTAVPDLASELQAELAAYRTKFDEAVRPMLQRISTSPTLSRPIPDGLVDAFQSQMTGGLEQLKKSDAPTVCRRMLDILKSSTVSSIRNVSEQAVGRYEEAVKSGASR
jgi:hypothetical protein